MPSPRPSPARKRGKGRALSCSLEGRRSPASIPLVRKSKEEIAKFACIQWSKRYNGFYGSSGLLCKCKFHRWFRDGVILLSHNCGCASCREPGPGTARGGCRGGPGEARFGSHPRRFDFLLGWARDEIPGGWERRYYHEGGSHHYQPPRGGPGGADFLHAGGPRGD